MPDEAVQPASETDPVAHAIHWASLIDWTQQQPVDAYLELNAKLAAARDALAARTSPDLSRGSWTAHG